MGRSRSRWCWMNEGRPCNDTCAAYNKAREIPCEVLRTNLNRAIDPKKLATAMSHLTTKPPEVR